MTPNPTMEKFGYPATRIVETEHWSVLLRPQQPTLGSLVVVCREDAKAFGAVSPAGFADLGRIVATIERVLKDFMSFERINYLMLMMVDPDVHFHVLPRYGTAREFKGVSFADAGWPGQPRLEAAVTLDGASLEALREHLAALWDSGAA